jgi:hypothetical protein
MVEVHRSRWDGITSLEATCTPCCADCFITNAAKSLVPD